MRDRIWLSFDIAEAGQGGLRKWLCSLGARECGPAMATLFYTYHDDLVEELSADLNQSLCLAPGDRVYLIYKDPQDGEVTGRFLFGDRGRNPGVEPLYQNDYTPLN